MSMEEAGEVSESADATATRHAREGVDVDVPSNDLTGRQAIRTAPDRVPDNDNGHSDAMPEQSCFVKEQPSHEDVKRLEADNERIQRKNEARNMVLDAIFEQLPGKIKSELSNHAPSEKRHAPSPFSKLSEAELKRLTKWLIEKKPFAELKEYEFEPPEDAQVSVEEECDGGADGAPVFPQAQVSTVQSSLDAPTKGKKTVQRTNSVLGEGTYGEVRIAKHKGQCYAAKELKIEDSRLMDSLYHEAACLALLDDENIVKFCGIGVYQGQHCSGSFLILTELLATSLHRYLMEEPGITLPNQISILSNVLSGLEYMHQEPCIIHGDIKTKNILLSKHGIAKVADLGSAHLANDDIVGQRVCGTTVYMAPETTKGENITKKIDVFAYGHLCLVTLTKWEIDAAEFNTRQEDITANKELIKRRKLFDRLSRPNFAVISGFIPLIKFCLYDDPNHRPSFDELQTQMQDLTLPRKLPKVTIDTAVRDES